MGIDLAHVLLKRGAFPRGLSEEANVLVLDQIKRLWRKYIWIIQHFDPQELVVHQVKGICLWHTCFELCRVQDHAEVLILDLQYRATAQSRRHQKDSVQPDPHRTSLSTKLSSALLIAAHVLRLLLS